MKELSIEEKAKAYDEAIERAKKYWNSPRTCVDIDVIPEIFPELREGRDEIIKEELINYLKYRCNSTTLSGEEKACNKWISWLEKQKSVGEIVERCKTSWYNEGKIAGMIEGLTDDEKYQQGWHDALEKQGEQKPCGQKEECVDCQFNYAGECKGSCAMKRSEQKPADKVQPKFKVGDWIVTDKNHIWLIDEDCSTTGYSYRLISQNGKVEVADYNIVDEHARLWSIEDAKDGDVLVDSYSKDSIIILYKGIYKERSILAHCGWNGYNLSIKTNGFGYGGLDNTNYSPATKEQHELLFQKMEEAGYTFDFETNELKKIEEPPVIDEGKAEMDYCFTKMMNGEKVSPTWTEDDEEFLNRAIKAIEHKYPLTANWLKTFKQRFTWKPSYEQLEALWCAAEKELESDDPNVVELRGKVLESLYNELKKMF